MESLIAKVNSSPSPVRRGGLKKGLPLQLASSLGIPLCLAAVLLQQFILSRRKKASVAASAGQATATPKTSAAKQAAVARSKPRRQYKVKRGEEDDEATAIARAMARQAAMQQDAQQMGNGVVAAPDGEAEDQQQGTDATGQAGAGGQGNFMSMLQSLGYKVVMANDGSNQVFLVPPGAKAPGAEQQGDVQGAVGDAPTTHPATNHHLTAAQQPAAAAVDGTAMSEGMQTQTQHALNNASRQQLPNGISGSAENDSQYSEYDEYGIDDDIDSDLDGDDIAENNDINTQQRQWQHGRYLNMNPLYSNTNRQSTGGVAGIDQEGDDYDIGEENETIEINGGYYMPREEEDDSGMGFYEDDMDNAMADMIMQDMMRDLMTQAPMPPAYMPFNGDDDDDLFGEDYIEEGDEEGYDEDEDAEVPDAE